MNRHCFLLVPALLLAACSSGDDGSNDTTAPKTDAQYERDVTRGMHDSLLADIDTLHQAAVELEKAAPEHAWDAGADADAVSAMLGAWLEARAAYERTEGAIAPLFPDIDGAIDARYDDFLAELGDEGDQDLFDGEGVTGMHAVERILFAPDIPESVTRLESTLKGYEPAAWPATDEEALEFKSELCAKLVTDIATLKKDWTPQAMDLDGAYGGLISLMNEQREKVNKAASEEEESRYAQRTMADIRDNLAGTTKIYGLFRPWLLSKDGGAAIDDDVQAAFAALGGAYSQVPGDAIPEPPSDWSAEQPSAKDLETPFGELYSAVQASVDPNIPGSAVDGMSRAAVKLGFAEFTEE
ncbi:MAG TPA: EfeM/EfeO family lipoprotein [Polyangiaceae bacterium]|jgi:iron uptake system component EfeO|nr:EfeM/EfeO family lipoprotein [Polyangiaceae bacterium]